MQHNKTKLKNIQDSVAHILSLDTNQETWQKYRLQRRKIVKWQNNYELFEWSPIPQLKPFPGYDWKKQANK